jgi:phage I-like protein
MKHVAADTVDVSAHAANADGGHWVHLLPAGVFSGRDGRGPYDAAAADEIIAASRDYAGRCLIPIDYDHQIDNAKANGKPAIAAGWIKSLQSRADGIWGLVEWTAKAAAHIAGKEYRYLSPVMGVDRSGKVSGILRAALTNNPNLNQLTGIAAMEAENMDKFIVELRKLLGLPDDADEQAIMDKLRETIAAPQSAMPDPAKFVPMGVFEQVVSENNRLNRGITLQAAQSYVDEQIRTGKMVRFLREWAVELCTSNKPAFDEFVGRTKKFFEPLGRELDYTHAMAAAARDNLSGEESEVARRMGLTDEEFKRGRRADEA